MNYLSSPVDQAFIVEREDNTMMTLSHLINWNIVYHLHVLNVKVWFWSDISKSGFKTKSNQAITFIGFGFTVVCDQLSSLVIGK